jgi:5-formyltetrahydrofolate cyclo-ligase
MLMGSHEILNRGSIIKGMAEKISEFKKHLRKSCRELRTSLGEDYRHKASLVICKHLETWIFFQKFEVILVYLPMRAEVNLLPLLKNYPNKSWLVPRISENGSMRFHPYDPERLIRHKYGMLEPDPTLPIIPANQVELVLTPGLAYDLHGWRLGYGGGFYDRFLSQQKDCIRMGVTFHALLQADLPHNEYDIPMQYLVTEDGVIELSPITPG